METEKTVKMQPYGNEDILPYLVVQNYIGIGGVRSGVSERVVVNITATFVSQHISFHISEATQLHTLLEQVGGNWNSKRKQNVAEHHTLSIVIEIDRFSSSLLEFKQ